MFWGAVKADGQGHLCSVATVLHPAKVALFLS